MKTKPGEVYLVDLGIAGRVRPMIVLSREDADPPRALAICAPITTSSRDSKYEIAIGNPNFLKSESFVNVQGLQAVSHHELHQKLGNVSKVYLSQIKDALVFALALEV
jgi:mRNA interferase MazF